MPRALALALLAGLAMVQQASSGCGFVGAPHAALRRSRPPLKNDASHLSPLPCGARRHAPAATRVGMGVGGFFESLFKVPDDAGGEAGEHRYDFPDSKQATLTELAGPVEGDCEEVAMVRPLLSGTFLERRPLRLAFDAAVDGWSAAAFHDRLDRQGPAVVVAWSEAGQAFGGYNPKGWVGLGEYRGTVASFLFTQEAGRLHKLPKVGGPGLAIVDMPDAGPTFGADGLAIALSPGRAQPSKDQSVRVARCKLGPYYQRMPDGSGSLFEGGAAEAVCRDLRAYVGVYGEVEEIPNSSADSSIDGTG